MKELSWGQTPFDGMSRDALLRLCQKLWTTVVALNTTAKLCRIPSETSPFWTGGTGAQALEMARQCDREVMAGYDSDNVYRSFFRYARDLLFHEERGIQIGSGWAVCPACGTMIGRTGVGESAAGMPCREAAFRPNCDGVYRKLEWSDLEPKPDASAGSVGNDVTTESSVPA